MESTSPKIDSHAVGSEEMPTEETEKKFVDACSTMEATLPSPSPTKPVQNSQAGDKNSSPLKPASDGVPAGEQVQGSTGKIDDHDKANSPHDVKMAENDAEQPSSSEEMPPNETSEKTSEDGKTAGTSEGTESGETGGVDAMKCSPGADDCNGTAGKAEDNPTQKVELMKLDASPKILSPTKTSCAV